MASSDILDNILGDILGVSRAVSLGSILRGILCCTLGGILGGSWVVSCVPKCYAMGLFNDILGLVLEDIRDGFCVDSGRILDGFGPGSRQILGLDLLGGFGLGLYGR